MKLQKIKYVLCYFMMKVVLILSTTVTAQVTVGLGEPAVEKALLQLKEIQEVADGSVNAQKGLGMPRVNISSLTPQIGKLSESIGSTGAWKEDEHIGLTVYNINNDGCNGFVPGIYVWDGAKWQNLGGNEIIPIQSATPEQTSGTDIWGDAVVLHQAKPNGDGTNIYEEFYSASFGAAGRWMTTNLAAWKYDTDIPSSTAPLPASPDASYTLAAPRWCYPNGGSGGATTTDYINNPHLGLFYNWIAVTRKKKDTSNMDQGQVEGAIPGPNEVEVLDGKIQGICPNGWHLPSDREWNELEKVIYITPQDYGVYSGSELPFKSTYDSGIGMGSDGTAQAGWRAEWESGTTANSPSEAIGGHGNRGVTPNDTITPGHGHAMKEMCGVNGIKSYGRSKKLAHGGFNVLLAGYAANGDTQLFGVGADFWSSSSCFHIEPDSRYYDAWKRYLRSDRATVNRAYNGYYNLFSVRCRKD